MATRSFQLAIEVTDSSAEASSVNVTWASLPASGWGLIPFSALTGTADLTSIDKIRITIQRGFSSSAFVAQ